jgi:hypothetical protein
MPVYATIPAHSKNIQEGPDPTRKKVLLMGLRMCAAFLFYKDGSCVY